MRVNTNFKKLGGGGLSPLLLCLKNDLGYEFQICGWYALAILGHTDYILG